MNFRNRIKTKICPPKSPPNELLDLYTMGGKIDIEYLYFNGVCHEPLIYPKEHVDIFIATAKKRKGGPHYPFIDTVLYEALRKYSIKGKKIAIMGSTYPWYESVCLAYGGEPITIEYNTIITDDKRLTFMTVKEYDKNPIQVDAAFSISSFEHDGLGRYGDPLDPDGDLKAMKKMKTIIKKDGIMFFNVPYGEDLLIWNAHRVYGKIRFPLLIKGWDILDKYEEEEFFLFVLKNI